MSDLGERSVNHTLILKLASNKNLGTPQIGRKVASEEPRRAPALCTGTMARRPLIAARPEPLNLIVANH